MSPGVTARVQFIGTAARAAGLGAFTKPRLGMLASLDHSMYFYDEGMDASEWLLFTMSSPALGHGRGLVSGEPPSLAASQPRSNAGQTTDLFAATREDL